MICLEDSEQGHRSDLEEACHLVRTQGLKRVAEEAPTQFVKYHRGLTALLTASLSHRSEQPEMVWLSGETGTGKTSWALDNFPAEWVYPVPMRATVGHVLWWDGYTQQRVVVIDDARPVWMSMTDILAIVNRFPYHARTHSGFVPLNSPIVVITSILTPQQYVLEGEPAG